MPRNIPGEVRPERQTLIKKSPKGKQKLTDIIDNVKPKIWKSIVENEQLEDCCRDVNNMTYETFYVKGQDHAGITEVIIECEECGRKQRRIGGTIPAK